MSDLHDARVEAAGEAVYDEVVISTYLTMSDCERIAEVALAAADAVVTVEMIAAALHGDECTDDPDEGESCGCDGNHYMRQGGIVLALLRGGEGRCRDCSRPAPARDLLCRNCLAKSEVGG